MIAVAQALNAVADQEKIARMDLVYMAEDPYDKNVLLQNGIKFKKIYSGKIRRYFSLLNVLDMMKIMPGVFKSVLGMYFDFPDAVFSKGGHESFPVVLAARILGIPVMIHESDAVPGRVNQWAGKFAKRIAVSFPKAGEFFSEKKVALTGNPIRKEFFVRETLGARDFFELEKGTPVVLVLGGSQGARNINENIIDILPELVKKCQIIHLCGSNNLEDTKGRSDLVLENSEFKDRYKLFPFLNLDSMRMAYGASDMAVIRAGASSIFEVAASGLPSVVIPLPKSAQDHQKENAYSYAKNGSAVVLEEYNLEPHILLSEIDRLLSDKNKMAEMGTSAKSFSVPDAAEKIARELISLAIKHK